MDRKCDNLKTNISNKEKEIEEINNENSKLNLVLSKNNDDYQVVKNNNILKENQLQN